MLNVNGVLTHTSDKLISQIKADVDIALKASIQAMEAATKRIEQTSVSVTRFEKELKTNLAKRIDAYNLSINTLFKLDGWRHMVFWAGLAGGILTPIALIVSRFI